jgi:phosphatidylglycerol lysyltransferase
MIRMSTHGRSLADKPDIGLPVASLADTAQSNAALSDAGQPVALESLAYRYGRTYDSYLGIDADRQQFWSASGEGAIAYVQRGRYLHVSGGLLAADEHKETLLAELLAFAHGRNCQVTFYNITDNDLPLFARHHFQITKWGEEAVLDLQGCTFGGKPFEWVRRQSNFCERRGLVFSEAVRSRMSDEAWRDLLAELIVLVPASLARKPQAVEIRFLEGRFDPDRLGRKRLFLARDESGLLEGFLLCNPAQAGQSWVFETYRQRPGGIRGTITFLKHRALEALQAEGVSEVSLCLIPGLHCRQPRSGDSRLVRWAMTLGSRVSLVFDTAGLYQFKTRFRPRFESRYLCAYPRATLGSLASFVQVLGVLDLAPRKLPGLIRSKLRRHRNGPPPAPLDHRPRTS